MATINNGVSSNVVAQTTAPTSNAATSNNGIANNFTQFLQLLTTQLKNQNPLDPLDTNQFTQQLVQFAQVEQQLKSNDQLATLVSLQQTTQQTQALGFVGQTVAVDGSTQNLTNSFAKWSFNVSKPATAKVSITDSTGQTVYTSNYTVQAGPQTFEWDGVGSDNKRYPDGKYKMTVTATDTNGQSIGISPEIVGTVDSVDLTQNPPSLSISGQTFTLNQVKRVTRAN
jgi:flagellar basal-body rod modification protein FlgD